MVPTDIYLFEFRKKTTLTVTEVVVPCICYEVLVCLVLIWIRAEVVKFLHQESPVIFLPPERNKYEISALAVPSSVNMHIHKVLALSEKSKRASGIQSHELK